MMTGLKVRNGDELGSNQIASCGSWFEAKLGDVGDSVSL